MGTSAADSGRRTRGIRLLLLDIDTKHSENLERAPWAMRALYPWTCAPPLMQRRSSDLERGLKTRLGQLWVAQCRRIHVIARTSAEPACAESNRDIRRRWQRRGRFQGVHPGSVTVQREGGQE